MIKQAKLWVLVAILTICGGSVLMFTGCQSGAGKSSSPEATAIIVAASEAKDNERVLSLADSLEKAGKISQGESNYWQGHAYYQMGQREQAKSLWQEAIKVTENSTSPNDLVYYAKSASYLTSQLCRYAEYAAALYTALPVINRLEKIGCDTTSDYTNLLVFAGCCKVYFDKEDSTATNMLERAYRLHTDHIRQNASKKAYRDAMAGIINIAYIWNYVKGYEKGLMWDERMGDLMKEYKTLFADDEKYIDKQWARYLIFYATSLEGTGRHDEAERAYGEYLQTRFSNTREGWTDANDYLTVANRWEEAADNYSSILEYLQKDLSVYSLDNIQRYLLKKYRAHQMLDQEEFINMTARQICEVLDSAITNNRHLDASELQSIHERDMEIVEAEASSARQRQIYTGLVVMILIIAFTIYTIFRHRANLKLRKAHEELKVAYDQLEETTAQKAAIESDLRIASGIQMGMLPTKFPTRADHDDVQLYASLTPAKEVGGDLFDFYFRDEKLFFCIGDVSGKGVPASLFMAVTRSTFRTVSAHESMPDRIVTIMNKTIADMNKNHMFVTLFVGVLDLPTRRLRYCNAGHDAPLLVGAGIGELPCDSNIPVGFMPTWKYSLQEAQIFTGTTIFLFTDGLTEAMDVNNAQFQMERINDVASRALANQQQEPRQLIDQMIEAVHQFVGDAEQSDDLTMMAIQYIKQQSDVTMRKSIVLSNDTQEVPRLNAFVEEVCQTVGFDDIVTMKVNVAIEEAVVNVMKYAYPSGHRGDVTIEAASNDILLKFTIIDSGKPFDPTVQAEIDTTLPAKERKMGGLGIHIMRQNMDSMNYERMDNLNVLTLRKKITQKQ
ncbi:MAG: SpoIIE family protein phosphatase [Prevotella sp.]|nr:SpoIIE family protein phosphatase [Prevotella sp.]